MSKSKKIFSNSSKKKLYEIIFEADTRAGKLFDVFLLILIGVSLITVTLESVESIEKKYGSLLVVIEWTCTVLFTLEYAARIYSAPVRKKYIFSFFGIIDFLAVLPTWLELFFTQSYFLVVFRSIRLLRVFRVFRLTSYLHESRILLQALTVSVRKITVFLVTVVTIVIIMGTVMYQVEGRENGFTSIPRSMYWAVVTLTTVGYGDISPKTSLGQLLASVVMILGYSIIAIPTGIVSSEIAMASKKEESSQVCPHCFKEGHQRGAIYCQFCGNKLNE